MFIPIEHPVPTDQPRVIQPYFDPDVLNKLDTTIKKAAAYLERASVASWWKSWLMHARHHTTPSETQNIEGK